ncbi:energy transducer TonB [Shewanella sp. 1CM18E]|uniref:energy transducer TonB n=1 Tax=Shewanella sp. 1CM18E TaxID=2929169 RepID=UPI0020BDEDA8|nr:TonB family protein [Shewanella sp. 1CM18E]MCK8044009.1 energy transducer TonB [Shewanella sp. 1CM18E]
MKALNIVVLLMLFIPQLANAKSIYGEVLVTSQQDQNSKLWSRSSEKQTQYPIELARASVTGCSVISFDISEEGRAENLKVESSVPNKPLAKFALKAVKRMDWELLGENAARAEKQIIRLDYCLGDISTEATKEQCAKQVLLNCA